MILLTIRDLRHRAVRFLVVTLLGAVVFSLLFVMTGLVEQFNREPVETVDAFAAESWIVPDGVAGPFTANSTLSLATIDDVDAASAVPVVISRSTLKSDALAEPSAEVIVIGHVPGEMGTPDVTDGTSAAAAGQAVVDDTLDLSVGDVISVGGVAFDVVGVSTDTTMLAGRPLVFVTLPEAQQLIFRSDQVISAVLANDLRSAPDGLVGLTAEAVAANALEPIEGAISSIDLVRGLLWIVAAMIVGAVVYLSALERQRDFAVLKAMGTPSRSLVGSLALQAVLVALAAVAFAAVIQAFLAPLFPLKVRVPARAFWQLPLLAVVIALIAGIAGMRKVFRADPAAAFAGAGA